MSKDTKKLNPNQLPDGAKMITVDVAAQQGFEKPVLSQMILVDGVEYWQAEHYKTGIYYTSNPRDPKILNYANSANPRPRGNLKFKDGGGNPLGRPKDSRNKISVRQACENLNANPADFLAAVMVGNVAELRRYGVKDPKSVTVAQKIKCAELLVNKLVPNLKPADLGDDGEAVTAREIETLDKKPQIQVYLPQGQTASIELTDEDVKEIEENGVDKYIEDHQVELAPYDSDDEDGELVWRVDK